MGTIPRVGQARVGGAGAKGDVRLELSRGVQGPAERGDEGALYIRLYERPTTTTTTDEREERRDRPLVLTRFLVAISPPTPHHSRFHVDLEIITID